MKRKLSILGSTGSIGTQCLDIIRHFPDEFEIETLSSGFNSGLFKEQLEEFNPKFYFSQTGKDFNSGQKINNLEDIINVDDSDLVVMALSGTVGISLTFEMVKQGRKIVLSNKESLVAAGDLIMNLSKKTGAEIIPVDSEHSAIWQCLQGENSDNDVASLIITGSGGPLRGMTWGEMEKVDVERVLKHPNWKMGKKITVDSATLINKVFEIQEAKNLFSVPLENIEVVMHKESIIHSMVRFIDGNVKALLSAPDMRLALTYALFHPRRREVPGIPRCDFLALEHLSFSEIERNSNPWLDFGMELISKGGLYPALLVGTDQGAVQLFLEGKIGFTKMLDVMKSTYYEYKQDRNVVVSLDSIQEMIQWSYEKTLIQIDK